MKANPANCHLIIRKVALDERQIGLLPIPNPMHLPQTTAAPQAIVTPSLRP